MRKTVLLLTIWMTACSGSPPPAEPTGQPAPRPAPSEPQQNALRGEYIVQMTREGDPYKLRSMFYDADPQLVEHLGGDFYLLRLNQDPGEDAVRQRVASDPTILMVQPNLSYGIPESEQPVIY